MHAVLQLDIDVSGVMHAGERTRGQRMGVGEAICTFAGSLYGQRCMPCIFWLPQSSADDTVPLHPNSVGESLDKSGWKLLDSLYGIVRDVGVKLGDTQLSYMPLVQLDRCRACTAESLAHLELHICVGPVSRCSASTTKGQEVLAAQVADTPSR